MNASLLDELAAANEQGERVLGSMWPGDSFYYRGIFWEIGCMQIDPDERHIFLTTTTPVGEPYLVPNHRLMNGERLPYEGPQKLHQPMVSFWFDGYLMFPALLSDEHAEAERADKEIW